MKNLFNDEKWKVKTYKSIYWNMEMFDINERVL